LIVTNR